MKVKLSKYLKPYALFAVLTPLSMVGEVLGDLLQPKLMSKIVDDGVLGQDMDLIIRTGLLMLLVLIGGGACGIAASAFGGIASQSFSRDLRVDVFKRVMGLSFEQTDKFTTGSLVTRLTADITAIQQMVDFMLRMLVRDSLLFFGGIIMMLTLNVRFGIIILCALPIEIIMMIVILKKANPYYSIVAKRLDSVNSVVQENVTGARVVKAYVREDTEEKRFDDANISLMESNLRVQTLMAILQPLLMIILNLSVIAVIVIGGWQVQAQAMKIGEVMAAITYLTQVLHGVMMMSMMFQTLAKASASANRLREVLETDPVIKSGSVSLSDKTGGTVSFKNVSFSYPETKGRPVISDFTLDIKSGESVAILGATGSGKSSLVNLIPRFYDCTAGEVLVDGVNVKDCKLDELRKKVGIVLQKSELFSGTVEDNIKWGDKNATHEEVISAAQAAQADEFIQKIPAGYEGIIAEKGASLSGGQKQRLSISRAVLKKPEILILDDSTSALDLGTEAKLRAEIDRKMNGTTLIIIAQRIQSVKSCDRIAVLDHGKLCACDTHENLLKTCEVYQDIYASQVKTSGGEV
ncbi:Putative multidrug export ATP-binding/permease protein SAV1866 [uncultured Ruminococcus sp.]|uniref:ABC transporter ATP-binding protein n=1 Tax=uncultured Ruminococcus sp. TaxID=165186 RepID=UPI0008226659|nr:ABC transporter ATP-binding protein [uncultured Ruminococcus sp.]MDR3947254.1 ABC transporter ATP-binding protein [Ruminococcus sp.]SCI72963.1 Putative multidrug export ATP-binding/permease protein SAV1866 [uncultured Ruminococcus sp.]SCJ17737.1 Putative multidrug export ATP-binding/permease protein SAV1866 [uncultured Ruminococcus sp.]